MSARIVLFGATGYTGALVAQRLVAAGSRPVLAGRSPTRLAALAERLGGLETARADAAEPSSLLAVVGAGDVLVTTVGPFCEWGEPAVRAAIAAGCTYLDTTGEPAFIRRVFGEWDVPAARAGARLLTALGYDYVPGALAGALALEAAPGAVRVDVGYFSLGAVAGGLSAGTRRSLVGAALSDNHAFRGGRLRLVRPAERVRAFAVAGRPRTAVSIGGAEHFTLPAAHPGLEEVNVYLGWPGTLARPVQAAAFAGRLARRVPGAGRALRAGSRGLVGLLPDPEPGTTPGGRSWIVAEAYGRAGEPLAAVALEGTDGYDFTARFLAWAARRAADGGIAGGPGALGPLGAFGLRDLEAGCREAGLARRRDLAAAPAGPEP